eukprot:SAG11_NODE_2814_length_2944_cov_2.698770_2_plen_160_part_00
MIGRVGYAVHRAAPSRRVVRRLCARCAPTRRTPTADQPLRRAAAAVVRVWRRLGAARTFALAKHVYTNLFEGEVMSAARQSAPASTTYPWGVGTGLEIWSGAAHAASHAPYLRGSQGLCTEVLETAVSRYLGRPRYQRCLGMSMAVRTSPIVYVSKNVY